MTDEIHPKTVYCPKCGTEHLATRPCHKCNPPKK